MAGRRRLASVDEMDTPSDGFEERTVSVRGKEFKIRELSSAEYDKLYKMADQGDDLDTALLLRLMTLKSVVEPKLTEDDLGQMPMRVSRELLGEVNRLHFGPDDEEESAKNA
jgi:hypothetical protein